MCKYQYKQHVRALTAILGITHIWQLGSEIIDASTSDIMVLLNKWFQSKNLSILFGSGCSIGDDISIPDIPLMSSMLEKISKDGNADSDILKLSGGILEIYLSKLMNKMEINDE